jgi:Domain of unknown function (DUF1127)
MTEISLQAGERLRIRTGRRLFLVMRTESSFEVRILRRGMGVRLMRSVYARWLRLHRSGARVARRFMQARREDAQARLLAQLDSRTLKDIGMEPYHGSSLAERVHVHRRRELLRTLAGRLGP